MEVHCTPEQEARIVQPAKSAGSLAEDFVKAAALQLADDARF